MLSPVEEEREKPEATGTDELFESSFSGTQKENEWKLNDYSDYFNDDDDDDVNDSLRYLLEILGMSEDDNK